MCRATTTNNPDSKRASPERDANNGSPKKSKYFLAEDVPMTPTESTQVPENRKLWAATMGFCQHWEADNDALGVRNVMAVFYLLAKCVAAGTTDRPAFLDYFPANEAWFQYVGRFLALYCRDVTHGGRPIRLTSTTNTTAEAIGGVKIETLKMADGFDAMATLINADCNAATKGKIPEIVQGSDLDDPKLQLVAMAAEFIKGKLCAPFEEDTEANWPFHGTEGHDKGTCHLMRQKETLRDALTFKGKTFEAAVLSTKTSDGQPSTIKLVAVLPDEDEVTKSTGQTSKEAMGKAATEFASSIDTLVSLVATPHDQALPDTQKKVEMPRIEQKMAPFNITGMCDKELPPALLDGLDHITEVANKDGEWKMDPMLVSKVVHATYLKVDETGFEAAAATAVIAFRSLSAVADKPKPVLRFDRGFLFFIIDMDEDTPHVLYHARVESDVGLKEAPAAPCEA
jgi:serine protease inhibitor